MNAKDLIEFWKDRLWRFFRVIVSTNRDFPYHDYVEIENEDEENELKSHYVVGTATLDCHGDQSKRFVSKRALIWCESSAATIRINHANNPEINLPLKFVLAAPPMSIFEIELHTNISSIYYTIPAEYKLYMYFEGVLPEEARDAE